MMIAEAMLGERLLEVIEKGGVVYQNTFDVGSGHYSVRKLLWEFATDFKLSQLLTGNYRVTIILEPLKEEEVEE